MTANVQLFLLWLLVTLAFYWFIPPAALTWRKLTLVLASLILIYAVAPWALAIAALVTALCWGWCRWHHRWRLPFKQVTAALTLLLPLIAVKLLFVFSDIQDTRAYLLVSLGLGFYTLKSIAVALDAMQNPRPVRLSNLLLLNYFFPIFSAGPVERLESFSDEALSAPMRWADLGAGAARIAVGLFKASFVADALIDEWSRATWPEIVDNPGSYSAAELFVFVLSRFVYTYVNFSGYMDIAVGAGRVFGLRIMENFNLPILASNIQDFWKRWHISLGNFVTRYVFFPLLLTFRFRAGPQLAIFLSFVMVGLWHEFTVNYLAWGVLHGAGLALVVTLGRWKSPRYRRVRAFASYRLLAWAVTIFYVSWVQTLANLPGGKQALALTLGLLGVSR